MTADQVDATLSSVSTLFFCVGAQKAATTWLYAQLRKHPDIHIARKEFHYWDTVRSPFIRWERMGRELARRNTPVRRLASQVRGVLKSGTVRGAALQRADLYTSHPLDHLPYAKLLVSGRTSERVVGDMSPAYALCPRRTFAEMASLHRDTRFIFIMRDPVDRLWSGLRNRYQEWLRSGEKNAELLGQAFDDAVSDPFHSDLRRSGYKRTITELEAAVPQSNILYLFYEHLFDEAALDKVTSFLGVACAPEVSMDVVYPGVDSGVALSQEQRARARRALAETYDFVTERFGDTVPASWMPARMAAMPKPVEMRSK